MHKYDVIFTNLTAEHQPIMAVLSWEGERFTGRLWKDRVLATLDLLRMDNVQDDINVCVCRNGDVVAVLNSVVCERPQTDWTDWGIIEYRHVTNPRNLNSIMYRAVTLAE